MKTRKAPAGMIEAVLEDRCDRWGYKEPDVRKSVKNSNRDSITRDLDVACSWLSKHPSMPTHAQSAEILAPHFGIPASDINANMVIAGEVVSVEWQRRMFLAPENPRCTPNGFQECDTCRSKPGSPTLCSGCLHNRELIERLQKSPGQEENPAAKRVKEVLTGCTLTSRDAVELIDAVWMRVRPEPKSVEEA